MWYNVVFACTFGALLLLMVWAWTRAPRRDWESLVKPRPVFAEEQPVQAPVRKQRGGLFGRLEQEAAKAGVRLTGRDFLAAAVLGGSLGFTVGLLAIGVQGGLLLSALGLAGPYLLLQRAKTQRARVLANQLEPALALLSTSLRAGASLSQAVEHAAQKSPQPIRDVLAQADRAVKLGAVPAEALEEIAGTVESVDWKLWGAATSIMSRVGGNLPLIYDRLSETLRDRRAFRDQMRALTAETRASALVVSLVPVGTVALCRMINPRYFEPMLSSWVGRVLFLACLGAIGFGWVVIQRMMGTVPGEG